MTSALKPLRLPERSDSAARDLRVDEFLAEVDVRARSRETYQRALTQWSVYLTTAEVVEATPTTVKTYRDWLLAKGLRATSVKVYLAAVKKYYRWCGSVIADAVRSVSTSEAHTRSALTADEVKRLLHAVTSLRDYAMINLMVRTGLRPVQIARARVAGLSVRDGRRVLHVQGKGRDSADDYVVLTAATWAPLATYLTLWQVDPGGPLFGVGVHHIAKIVRRAMVAAGVWSPRVTSYSLRHTAATLALKGGASVVQVAAMLSHRQLRTTMVYLRDVERLTNPAESVIDGQLTEEDV